MRLAWHIILKDLRRLRLPLALWMLLMVAKLCFYAAISGLWGPPNLDWIHRMQGGPELLLTFAVEPLIAYFLVALLVYEDPLSEPDPFWVTRPISGRLLLAAKIMGAALMFVALPVLVNLPWWYGCGLGIREMEASARVIADRYAIIVVIGLACASATDGFPRYVLWTVVGMAAVATVHMLIFLILGQGVGVVINPADNAVAVRGVGTFVVCLVLVSLVLILQRFLARYRGRHALMLIAIIVVCLGIERGSRFDDPADWAPQYSAVQPDDARFRIRMVGDASYRAGLSRGRSRIPMKWLIVPSVVDGVRQDELTFRHIEGEWTQAGATVWKSPGYYGNQRKTPSVILHLLGLPANDAGPFVDNVQFEFPRQLVPRIEGGGAAYHQSETLSVSRGRIVAKLPLTEHSQRYPRGTFSISNIQRDRDGVSFMFTERSSPLADGDSQPPYSSWGDFSYYALIGRDGSYIDSTSDWVLYPFWTRLNMVSVSCKKISFRVPPGGASGDDLVLAVINFRIERVMKRILDADPFPFREAKSSGNLGIP